MAHSNQMREFVLSNKGISARGRVLGTGEVLTGSARVQQEAKDRAQAVLQRESDARRAREIEHEEAAARAQIEVLQRKLATLEAERRNVLAGGQERVRLEAALRSRGREPGRRTESPCWPCGGVPGTPSAPVKGGDVMAKAAAGASGGRKSSRRSRAAVWELRLYVAGQTPARSPPSRISSGSARSTCRDSTRSR